MSAKCQQTLRGYGFFRHAVERGVQQAALKWEGERTTLLAEANRKVEEAERDRQAKAAAEAEQKRKADEAEQQRLTAVKAEQDRQAEAKRKADEAERQQLAALKREQERARVNLPEDRALCSFALNSQTSGWDQNPTYRGYVTEASRRSLTVDSCRRLLGIAVDEAGATRKSEEAAQQRGLFTIRRGMEGKAQLPRETFYSLPFGECEQKCAQQKSCNVFTYSKSAGTGACYLYTSAGLVPNADFDSGVRN